MGTLPISLKTSVYCFFLANVVRDLRGDSLEPRTMMINISRFVRVQKYIKGQIEIIFNDVYNEIKINFSEVHSKNINYKLYKELYQCWEKYYSNIEFPWEEISKKENLLNAIENIEILIINSGKNSDRLDYEKKPHLRAIAVGGLALSRGLTLEGLLVSYFYRNTSTYDVLMQMGRWFGYRKNYEDLFKIWTSKKSADWYNEIAENTDNLKKDISRMKEAKLTPEHFGLRVRNDSNELMITARNKMRLAVDHIEQVTYWGSVFETPYIDTDINKLNKNFESTNQFINNLIEDEYYFKREEQIAKKLFFCKNVDSDRIIKFLRKLNISPFCLKFDTLQIIDFLENNTDDILKKWDIVLIEGDRVKSPMIDDLVLNKYITLTQAERGFVMKKNRICIGGGNARLGSPTDARNGLLQKQIDKAKKMAEQAGDWDGFSSTIKKEVWFKHVPDRNPLLMIYFLKLKDEGLTETEKSFVKELNVPIMGFSVGFPMTKNLYSAEFHKYKVNIVYTRQDIEDSLDESLEE